MDKNLEQWLRYLEQLHPCEIELGLTRIAKVANDLDLINFTGKVITVGGTNGKGTTCAFLEEILIQAGYKVGVYSSPHIQHYTERLRINHQELSEAQHCQAFSQIEAARKQTSLSYFEYATLSCLQLLKEAQCDFILLEVGLGGRLDATNVVESDISVITTIAIDHTDWLGDDREKIGFEKAGIFRAEKPAICGELNPPQSLQTHAADISADIRYAGIDFILTETPQGGIWRSNSKTINMPKTLMPMQNAATALAVIEALQLDLDEQLIYQALSQARLAGRLQKLAMDEQTDIYLDVAHNPQAAKYLAGQLQQLRAQKAPTARVFAIIGMLEDKDISGTFEQINEQLDDCSLISLDCPRGASAESLLKHYQATANKQASAVCLANMDLAYKHVLKKASSEDIIIIFGSFYTVSGFLTYLEG